MRARLRTALGAIGLVVLGTSCAKDLDTSRDPAPRGTLGEELYGVMCDRVGAQALREDLTGASFNAICHKDADGAYADKVDATLLPALADGSLDADGKPVPLAAQTATRAYAVNRIEALARRRGDLIAAFDATFPDAMIPVKDVANADPARSCDAPAGDAAQRTIGHELADMLGKMGPLYDDGTLPRSTESIARIMDAFAASPDAQTALARFSAREGYRPQAVALGLVRPLLSYPRFRDLSAETLRLLSPDSNPYDPDPKRTPDGARVAVPGPAYAQLSAMLRAAREELRTSAPDAPLAVLGGARDAKSARDVLSRPRTNVEIAQRLLLAQDPAFGGDAAPRFIVKRDLRGFAVVPRTGAGLPAPFVDADGDGLPDVDPLGAFLTTTGALAPSPFVGVGAANDGARDVFGRPLAGGNVLLYDYLDTSHTFLAQAVSDLRPLVDADPTHDHETIMGLLGGAKIAFGARTGAGMASRAYAADPSQADLWRLTHAAGDPPPADLSTRPLVLAYDGYDPARSPLLDLTYAIGQILGDPSTDDLLAYTSAWLTSSRTADVARLAGAALAFKAIADKHPEAHIAGGARSVFWDEMLDVFTQIAQTDGLLEAMLRALADPASKDLKRSFSAYMRYGDHISYDRNNLNGAPVNVTAGDASEMHTPVDRTKPDTGLTRSGFQRFLQVIHDTNGVTACNKEGATVHVQKPLAVDVCAGFIAGAGLCSLPGSRPFHECEVFKTENLAAFYLDSIVKRAHFTFRPGLLSFLGSADVVAASSGIDGFWPDGSNISPMPKWLNRLVFFDQASDSISSGDKNYLTNRFLKDLQGPNIGTAVCPERVIDDPVPGAPDVSKDKKVHGLRACKDGDWLMQRDVDATFVWEQLGFYDSFAPTIEAFAGHSPPREDLLLQLMEVLHHHWQDDRGTANECDPSDPKSSRYCAKDGLVTYEPLLGEGLAGDVVDALHDGLGTLERLTIPRCDAYDQAKKTCTASHDVDGITVLASAARALLDPNAAAKAGLKDRAGKTTALRNDGTTNPQVTPIYLLTSALGAIDQAFDDYAKASPSDADRQAKWRLARSQLVDQFLRVNGATTASAFANPTVPVLTPVLVDTLRAQLLANCPATFAPAAPTPANPLPPRCEWARTELTKKLEGVVSGPLFAGSMDMLDAVRGDDAARRELELLLTYLMDTKAPYDALSTMLSATADLLQMLGDDADLVPIYHVLAQAAEGSVTDATGAIVRTGTFDAETALLARIADRAYDEDHHEICAREMDPNQVLNVALKNAVTPMPSQGGRPASTPLQVIMDVVADVNRVAPERTDRLDAPDYASISSNVSDFLLNQERGLEQFYAIVRKGTE